VNQKERTKRKSTSQQRGTNRPLKTRSITKLYRQKHTKIWEGRRDAIARCIRGANSPIYGKKKLAVDTAKGNTWEKDKRQIL